MPFINLLKPLMLKNDISPKEVAITLGKSIPTIANWMENKTQPDVIYIPPLMELLNIYDIGEFLMEVNE